MVHVTGIIIDCSYSKFYYSILNLLRLDCTQTSWHDRFDTTYIDMIKSKGMMNDAKLLRGNFEGKGQKMTGFENTL